MKRVLLGAGMAAVVALVWALASGDDAPEPTQDDAPRTEKTVRAKPTDEEVAERRRRRLLAMSRGKVVETRVVTVRALKCGLLPAPNARIAVDLGDGRGLIQAGEADGLGKRLVKVPKLSTPTFVAEYDGHEGASAPEAGDAVEVNACPGATVVGKVVDPKGAPVEGADIVLGEEQDVAVSDAEGRFVLTDIYLTALTVSARFDQLSAELAFDPPLEPGEEREMTLRLEPGRRLVGVVVDREGLPVPRATVTATSDGGEPVASTRSDKRGRFWLKGVPFLPLSLQASSDQGVSRPVAVGEQERRTDLVLTVQPGAVLVFVSPEGDNAGATYSVFDRRRPVASALFTVSGGTVVVDAPGQYSIEMTMPNGQPQACGQVGVFPGDRIKINCHADGPATVTGRVVDTKGDPIAGANVFAISRSRRGHRAGAVSGSDGTFSFTMDERGQVTVAASLPASTTDGRFEYIDPSNPSRPSPRGPAGYGRKTGIPVARGVVTDVGDIEIITQEERMALHRQRRFGGVGAVLSRTADGPVFSRLVEGGPLDRAGVKAYDVILAVDGSPAYNDSVMTLVRKLRGQPGAPVDLTLWRDGQELSVTVERNTIDADNAF